MKAICCGYYGKGNGGDEALLASLLQMLPADITPIVLSGNPQKTEKSYQVKAYERTDGIEIIKLFQQADIFIWGGGSLIQDATSFISPFYYVGLMGLAQRMGLQTVAWAQGIGPLNYRLTKEIAKHIYAETSFVSVRDEASANLLKDWQIPFDLAPDPVWALDAVPVTTLANISQPKVAVTLRQHRLLTPARLQCLKEALIEFQKTTQTFIILLPFQKSQDLALSEELHSSLAENSQILILENPRELKGVYRGVEMAIGMRLHSLIMAASEGCKCYGLSYDPKVSQLMQELSIPGYELSEIPTDSGLICRQWLEQYDKGKSLTKIQIKSLMEQALIHQQILGELLYI